jgi:hypothetical protein
LHISEQVFSLLDGKFTVSVIFYWQLLLITVIVLSVLIITVVYCHFYCQCCELVSITVPFTVSAAIYCHLLSLYCQYCELLSFTFAIDRLALALELRLRLIRQGKLPLYKDFFFSKSFLIKCIFFLASRDNYNDTKHYMCILEN